MKSENSEIQKTSQFKRLLLRFTVKGIISLDHINIVSNFMSMGTSLHKGITVFDFIIILIDIFNLVFF